jgi:hypothetical protein
VISETTSLRTKDWHHNILFCSLARRRRLFGAIQSASLQDCFRGSSVCALVKIAESEMHNLTCAACGRALVETSAWKGSGERFYCNDFCAEAEETDINLIRYALSTKSPEQSRPLIDVM